MSTRQTCEEKLTKTSKTPFYTPVVVYETTVDSDCSNKVLLRPKCPMTGPAAHLAPAVNKQSHFQKLTLDGHFCHGFNLTVLEFPFWRMQKNGNNLLEYVVNGWMDDRCISLNFLNMFLHVGAEESVDGTDY